MSEVVQDNIYQLLPKIAQEIGSIPKLGKNSQQGFNFRRLDDTVDAFHRAVIKFGVTCIPRVVGVEHVADGKTQRCYMTVEYAFFAPDGSAAVATVVGEGADSYDKATSKALSMAFKYMLFQTFSIPTGDADPDADSGPAYSAPSRVSAPLVDDPDKVDSATVVLIRELLVEAGYEDQVERAAVISQYAGRSVPTLGSLTRKESERVIDKLMDDVEDVKGAFAGTLPVDAVVKPIAKAVAKPVVVQPEKKEER